MYLFRSWFGSWLGEDITGGSGVRTERGLIGDMVDSGGKEYWVIGDRDEEEEDSLIRPVEK